MDSLGNMYVSELWSNRLRKIDTAGYISTVVGNGTLGYGGDGGPATSAALNGISGVVFDSSGNLYISDVYNNRVRIYYSLPPPPPPPPPFYPSSWRSWWFLCDHVSRVLTLKNYKYAGFLILDILLYEVS